MKIKAFLYSLILGFLTPLFSQGQDVSITLGPPEIGENQAWMITLTVKNDKLSEYSDFPDIEGMRKRGTSSASNTQIINGQVSSSQSVTMTYVPDGQGSYTVPSFSMTVNGKPVSVSGMTVKVGPPVQQQRQDPFRSLFDRDPADSFFGDDQPKEFVDIKEEAFFALTTDKDEVYIGEGFNTTLSFYVADNNRAPLEFYELGKQLGEIMKKVRPENCWEENFNIENIYGERVTIQGKGYTQYKIYQGVFFPLNDEDVVFPSVSLKMIKYKVARNPSFFGQNRQEDFKSFSTKPKTVEVKPLPPHPLKDQVAVGLYSLNESVSSKQLETGQSFTYEFNIYGQGNISAINPPVINETPDFEFYDPNMTQNINRRNSRISGSKSFSYFGIPNEPGEYNLGNYFQWIYFDIEKERYDTLKARASVIVEGESRQNENILASDMGSFYDQIQFENNTLSSIKEVEWMKIFANIAILLMLAGSAFIFFKK
jgi:hypothetical protein